MNILACMPVKFDQFTEEQKGLLLLKGMVEGRPTYQDSTQVQCENCRCDAWLGPRQKEKRTMGISVVLCWTCVIKLSHSTGKDMNVEHLGNEDEMPAGDN